MGELVHMVTAPNRQDRQLMQRAAAGDAEARREVAGRLLQRVRNTTYYIVRQPADADDIAQTTLVDVLRHAASFRGETTLERWADRIAVRNALRFLKRSRQRREQQWDLTDQLSALEGPDSRLVRRELSRELARLLGRMPEPRRAVVVLRLIHQHSVSEIADMLDVPVNTVRDRLQVGRRELRKWIAKDRPVQELIGRRTP